jgi:hypothetical protein
VSRGERSPQTHKARFVPSSTEREEGNGQFPSRTTAGFGGCRRKAQHRREGEREREGEGGGGGGEERGRERGERRGRGGERERKGGRERER